MPVTIIGNADLSSRRSYPHSDAIIPRRRVISDTKRTRYVNPERFRLPHVSRRTRLGMALDARSTQELLVSRFA